MDATTQAHTTICPLCEATCGLVVTTAGRTVTGVRGNPADVFSHGYLCPKGYALKELDADPDRLRGPQIREGDHWRLVTWAEAFAHIADRLPAIQAAHGYESVAVYLGNPNVHNLAATLYNAVLLRALRSRNRFTASTLDQMPKQVACALLFGDALSIPIPDIDRTDYLLIMGANPLVSNGSLLTAPDMRGRLRALRARGGRIVVVDPRRTRTADEADQHLAIQPGADAYLLFALIHTLFAEDLVRPGRLLEYLTGLERVAELARDFAPEAVAERCGIPATTIRQVARDLAAAPHAAVYGRIGTCTQEYGTLASWLIEVVNILTGNLDRPGGALFPLAPAGQRNATGTPGHGPAVRFGKFRSRVRSLPQIFGEIPTATLADEIETPGPGQVRALITLAGNPALSAPGADRLQRALGTLEFIVSVDPYRNETTRYADVILPPPGPLERGHYDLAFTQLAIHDVARYAPPIFASAPEQPSEWEILLRLASIVAGQGPAADIGALDDQIAADAVAREVGMTDGRLAGRDAAEILAALAPRRGPERLLDLALRAGPYGDGFGATPGGLTLAALEAVPNGIDLGPLQPRLPEVLRTPSGKVELAPEPIVADVARLRAGLAAPTPDLVLVGRRELRSNNSWMHNLGPLVKGPDPCAMLVHPADIARWGLTAGANARVTTAAGSLIAPVEADERMRPGVVSLPHGWGHDLPGVDLAIAQRHPGQNLNRLVPDTLLDPLSGTVVQNAVPVAVEPA